MPTFYHVTPIRNLKSIQKDGLVPKIGPRSRELGEPFPAVYLFPDLDTAEYALMHWLGNHFSEDARLALIAADVPEDVPAIYGAGFECLITTTIGPECLRVLSRDVLGEKRLADLDPQPLFPSAPAI
jgi:hypothetical protein